MNRTVMVPRPPKVYERAVDRVLLCRVDNATAISIPEKEAGQDRSRCLAEGICESR